MSNFFHQNNVVQQGRPSVTAPASMHYANAAKSGLSMPVLSKPSPQRNFSTATMREMPPPAPRKPEHEPRVVRQGFDQKTMEQVFQYSNGTIKRIPKHIYDAKRLGKRDLSAGLTKIFLLLYCFIILIMIYNKKVFR